MSGDLVVALVAAVCGGGLGGVLTVIVKGRQQAAVTDADAKQRQAHARAEDVDTLRQIIAEVRDSELRKTQRIDALEHRLDKLEERERHMLTRAAVHEAWDQLAFQALVAQGNAQFPPPPPLTPPDDIRVEQVTEPGAD